MAIQKSRRIPPLNPLRFIPVNYTPPEGINTYPFDKGFFHQQIRTFATDKRYYHQKVMGCDIIGVYVDSLAPSINISLLNNKGVEVHDFGAMTAEFVLAANLDPDFGLPYKTHTKTFKPDDISLAEGEYYVLLEHLYGGSRGHADNTYDVSECIDVADEWEDTMLIKYSHNVSEFDVLFESSYGAATYPIFPFYFRAEMLLWDPEHNSSDTAWEDQLNVIQQEQSIPFNLYDLTIGGNGGVPPWVTDKVNRILSCNKVLIDNVQFRKNSGASWKYEKAPGCAVRAATITLREVDTSHNHVVSNVPESDAERFFTETFTDFFA